MTELSAGMVELADTLDLGSSGKPCRFKSCCPHPRNSVMGPGFFYLLFMRAASCFLTRRLLTARAKAIWDSM